MRPCCARARPRYRAGCDPAEPAQPGSLHLHGNPNVLTRDAGTSTLAQATSAHNCLVAVERYEGPLPEVNAFRQPPMTTADQG